MTHDIFWNPFSLSNQPVTTTILNEEWTLARFSLGPTDFTDLEDWIIPTVKEDK